jgi:DNA-binding NtrC family response regulator
VKTLTVLLILDEPRDPEIYGIFLRNRAYETLIWNSSGEAINSLGTESVSLVIVGQDTPAFEGRQVLEYSLRCHPEVPVLVIGRSADMHFYLEAMKLGATDYLESPEPRDLAWLVDTQVLRSKAPRFSVGSC